MWLFQNHQVWTWPLPAERASWCLTSAAFNDCLSAESSSSDHLCTNLPVWLETRVVTLPFASAGKAVITSSNFKKSYFYSDHQLQCSCYGPACKFMYLQTLWLFPQLSCAPLLWAFPFNQQNMTLFPVWRLWCVCLSFFLYWQQNEQQTSKDMACVLAGSTWKGVAIPWTIKAQESAAVNRAAEKLWWMCICFAHHQGCSWVFFKNSFF